MRRLLLLVVLGACGGAGSEPGPRTAADELLTDDEDPVSVEATIFGLHPGESMTFEVSLGGMIAGEAALAVGEVGQIDGKDAIKVTSRVATTGAARWFKVIEDNLTTTIDVASGMPLSHVADSQLGQKLYHADNVFDGPRVDLAWYKNDKQPRKTHYDFRDFVAHDAHTAMAALRTWEGADGETRRLYLVGGRRIWQTDVTWVGPDTIATQLGNVAVIRLEGTSVRVTNRLVPREGMKTRTFTVWLSDDGDRVPVRVAAHTELGDVVIELTSYTQ